ncbi:MAG: UDP-3-O-(3-hydroxymyristoyl)glucosamine N-acyltransferase [Phycisphaerales bacterium]
MSDVSPSHPDLVDQLASDQSKADASTDAADAGAARASDDQAAAPASGTPSAAHGAPGPMTVADLAERLGAAVTLGEAVCPPTNEGFRRSLSGVNTLEAATSTDVTFITRAAYVGRMLDSAAAAVIAPVDLGLPAAEGPAPILLRVPDVELAVATTLECFARPDDRPPAGIDATAAVHADARVSPDAAIGPHVSIGPRARVAAGAVLHPGVRVAADAIIGARTVLRENVVVGERCRVGDDCQLHAGVVLGADGFNYRPDPDVGLRKIPHIGDVVIEDHVEIGANSCVDRGKFGSTVIGAGTKFDNLVQIGHNCVVGRCVVIAGSCALAGSVTVGDGVMIGGGTHVRDHVTIGEGAQIGGSSAVPWDVPAGQRVLGVPVAPIRETLRAWMPLRTMLR